MRCAYQIPIPIDCSLLVEKSLKIIYSYNRLQKYSSNLAGNPVAIETYEVLNSKDFVDQLPYNVLQNEIPGVQVLKIPASNTPDPVVAAHVDVRRNCAINVYLKTAGEITNFYTWNKEEKKSYLKESFCSNTGETWLMNSTVPHSVILIPNTERVILTFSFKKIKYEEMIECLKIN